LPNSTLKPAETDKYVILDITLPPAYITTAETALEAATQSYINENSSPHVKYNLNPDPRYFKTNGIELHIGDYITIVDTALSVSFLTRIIQLEKSLTEPYTYKLEVSDYNEVQISQKQYSEVTAHKRKIAISNVGDITQKRANWKSTQELKNMVFDSDGYFTDSIKPLSIETAQLAVGAKSREFTLNGVTLEANYTSDKTKFHSTAGSLVHFAIAATIQTWVMYANDETGLTDGTAYYIYARCVRDTYDHADNKIILDSTALAVDEGSTYYYFLVGVLHSVVSGIRGMSTTYGHTLIDGGYIKTGTIDADVVNVIHLDVDNVNAGTLTVGYTDAKCTDANADQTSTHTAADTVKVQNYTMITGGKITTGLITCDNINAGTLTGRTVQTASTGARIILNAAGSGNLYVYDSSNHLVINLDDTNGGMVRVGYITGLKYTNNYGGVSEYFSSTLGNTPIYVSYWTGSAWDSGRIVMDYDGNIALGGATGTGRLTAKDVKSIKFSDAFANQVVGSRVVDARCDDAIDSGDATTDGVIDSLRDAMIAHGLIAAS